MQIKNLLLAMVAGTIVLASCNTSNSQQIKLATSADSAAYAIGVDLGNNIKKNLPEAPGGKELNSQIILQAFATIMKGDSGLIASSKAGAITQSYFVKAQSMEGGKNKEAGQKFLADNGKRAGVTTTASGLQYEVLKAGTGPKPSAENTVKVHYHGTTIDGKVFDSSVDRGEPVTFGLGQVIKGWTEALSLMPVGSKWKIFIPSELGYGEQAAGPKIKPNSTLIFEVELISIEPTPAAAPAPAPTTK
jgi:FKBP-type peptidyl-prolyl cis-trans isomerase